MKLSLAPCAAAAALLLASAPAALAPDPASADDGQEGSQDYQELERKVDILAEEIERLRFGEVAPPVGNRYSGLGPAASKVYNALGGLSIGGYGELVYENFRDSATADSADFLRMILYVGYKFSDRWILNTEIEIEHADEIFLEFATLDYLWEEYLNFRVGLLLVPMGFVNELHEPTTFLSVRRPDVESFIIPSTWRENGVGIYGQCEELGLQYRSYFVNGLRGEGFEADQGLRGGRQKGSQALADDWAAVARVDYVGCENLIVGGSYYYGDSGQNTATGVDAETEIYEAHVQWTCGGFQARALYANADVDDVAALATTAGLAANDAIGEELDGGYVEVGYDVLAHTSSAQSLVPFVRWETYDLQRRVPMGFVDSGSHDVVVTTLGVSWMPFANVVFKADIQDYETAANDGVNQFNLGMGYIF